MTKETKEFKPLPSDLIQDPHVWSEWKLDDRMRVVRKDQKDEENKETK